MGGVGGVGGVGGLMYDISTSHMWSHTVQSVVHLHTCSSGITLRLSRRAAVGLSGAFAPCAQQEISVHYIWVSATCEGTQE